MKHQFCPKDDVETKVAKAQAEVVDVLPYALRTQAGVKLMF